MDEPKTPAQPTPEQPAPQPGPSASVSTEIVASNPSNQTTASAEEAKTKLQPKTSQLTTPEPTTPAKQAASRQNSKTTATKPILTIVVSVVLFALLCAVAYYAYSQSN